MGIYRWLVGHVDILGLTIDFLSLAVSIVLTIVIYKLERRHERDREKAEERAQELAISESAKIFIIDNEDEVEYLPLAEVAAKLNLKRKHYRNIITRYLRCNEQQQKEILRQANVPDIDVSTKKVRSALRNLQADLDRMGFGKRILYDGAKYLHRAFERWSGLHIDDVNPYIFEPLQKSKWLERQEKVLQEFKYKTTLFSYMFDYAHSENIGIDKSEIQPPIDMVFQKCDLGTCDECYMTFWTMRIIVDACHVINDSSCEDVFDESLIETQEDMYYYTLSVLCQTYATEGKENERTGKTDS